MSYLCKQVLYWSGGKHGTCREREAGIRAGDETRPCHRFPSEAGGLGEHGVVDGVDDGLGGEDLAAEQTAVEALEGIVAALEVFKFDVYLAFVAVVVGDGAVHHLPVLGRAFVLEVVSELLLPSLVFTATLLVCVAKQIAGHLLGLVVGILDEDAAGGVERSDGLLGLSLGARS